MKNIFFYGAPGSGKTTIGRNLANQLGLKFIDIDAQIVDRIDMPIADYFKQKGEAAFRMLEAALLEATVVTYKKDAIISLGGGTLLSAKNRALCEKNGIIFCLETPDAQELRKRLGRSAIMRPLGDKSVERAEHYASFPNRVASFFKVGDSFILVGTSIAPIFLEDHPVVADATVASLYRNIIPAPLFEIPSGEQYKTIGTVQNLWSAFAQQGLGRHDIVCALGGGVTGDLTGFAAATWMRGISWINVPTTLLAMVDASTGGKTGCDLPEGKNLAGAFHVPTLVVIDTDFLKTLPPAIRAAGHAEMIKHEIIGGVKPIVGDIPTATEIAKNLMVKVDIVRQDPLERFGKRLLLNCGHTVAHAVEKLTNYRLSHGEAVAIGCVEEARLAQVRGLSSATWPAEVAARFAAAGLPTTLPDGLTFDALRETMRGDKKRRGNVVTFALPCAWHDVRPVAIDLSDNLNISGE